VGTAPGAPGDLVEAHHLGIARAFRRDAARPGGGAGWTLGTLTRPFGLGTPIPVVVLIAALAILAFGHAGKRCSV
jgi:hypothetical protein